MSIAVETSATLHSEATTERAPANWKARTRPTIPSPPISWPSPVSQAERVTRSASRRTCSKIPRPRGSRPAALVGGQLASAADRSLPLGARSPVLGHPHLLPHLPRRLRAADAPDSGVIGHAGLGAVLHLRLVRDRLVRRPRARSPAPSRGLAHPAAGRGRRPRGISFDRSGALAARVVLVTAGRGLSARLPLAGPAERSRRSPRAADDGRFDRHQLHGLRHPPLEASGQRLQRLSPRCLHALPRRLLLA